MQCRTSQGLSFLTFQNLDTQPHLRHGFSLRLQTVEKNNTAETICFDLSPREKQQFKNNLNWFGQALALNPDRIVRAGQVHKTSIAVIREPSAVIPDIDGLCTNVPGIGLMLLGADCPLIIVYDPTRPAVGLAHAGWRGTVQQIALRLVETMTEKLGCSPEHMLAGIGPGICANCFEVGPEVADIVHQQFSYAEKVIQPAGVSTNDEKWLFDLSKANRLQLLEAGLLNDNIETSGLCTAERCDQFFSYRKEGKTTGRHALLAGCI